jgi:hypothetical protein
MKFLEIAEMIQQQTLRIRIAFLAPHLADNENTKAMETFSFNRGISVKYFHDHDQALEWLLNQNTHASQYS